jgi:hypothetical protein
MAIFSPLLEGQFCSRELQLLTVPYKQYFSFSYRRNLPLPSFSVAKMKTQIVISVGGDSPRRCSWSKYFFPCYQFWFLKIIIHCRGIGSSFADRIDLLSILCTCIEELEHINLLWFNRRHCLPAIGKKVSRIYFFREVYHVKWFYKLATIWFCISLAMFTWIIESLKSSLIHPIFVIIANSIQVEFSLQAVWSFFSLPPTSYSIEFVLWILRRLNMECPSTKKRGQLLKKSL